MRVDHLVWYCADLAEAEAHFAGMMDRQPAYGGVHPGEGTRNCLLSLGEQTYLEILCRDPEQGETGLDPEVRALAGSGFYHWAAGGADLPELRRKVLAAGLEASDVLTGGRTLPDGSWLGWEWFALRNHGYGALVPFVIGWSGSAHPASTAPRGGTLVSVEVSSPEADRLRGIYEVLGLDIEVTEAEKPALVATVESRSGRHALRMFDPVPRGYVI